MTKSPLFHLLLLILARISSTQARGPRGRLLPRHALYSSSHFPSLSSRSPSRNSLFGVILSVRGGDLDLDDDEDSDDEDDVELDELSEEEESELEDKEQVVECELKADSEDDDDEESSRQREDPVEDSTTSSGPVKLTIKTNLQCPISDQCLEFTASGKRTVASLKQG